MVEATTKRTLVINLFGGPGCGKSTLSYALCRAIKESRAHGQVELVREYVKEWAWSGRKVKALDQLTILGQQAEREVGLYGKVDIIVTDSPLWLSPFYHEYYAGQEYIKPAVRGFLEHAAEHGVEHVNFMLAREKAYDPEGRYETEDQARALDDALAEFLDLEEITMIQTVQGTADQRAATILAYVSARQQLGGTYAPKEG